MTRALSSTLAFVLAVLTVGPAAAQPAPPAGGDLQQQLNARVADVPGTGIVVGVIEGAKTTIYKAGSTGTAVPLDEHTEFEIGSVTKTFTATVLAAMVRDGTVKLDDPVGKYLPASVHVPSRNGKAITLLNLATQHSGLPRLPSNMEASDADPYAHYSARDMYAFLNGYTLPRDPGASFEYSNYGVGLLGQALANAAHTSYASLVQTRVLAPLAMKETAVAPTAAIRAHLAAPHTMDGEAAHNWTFDALAPAGAIVSSVDDMLKYVRCNMGQGSLGATCLFAQQPRDTIPANSIGLIWWTGNVRHIIHHGGDTQGYHAAVAIAPDHTRGVVVLANGGAPVEDVAIHALDPTFPIAKPDPLERNDPAVLDTYVGTYAGPDGTKYVVTRRAGQLYAKLGEQETVRVFADGKDTFAYHIVDAQIQFTHDEQGKVNALVLHQDGKDVAFVKPGMAPPKVIPTQSFPPAVALDAATLDGYAGKYSAGNGLDFVVRRAGEGIEVQLAGQPFIAVFASAKDHFYYKVVRAQIDFDRDTNGRIKSLTLHQNGQTIIAVKQ
ncbi:MAG TPA: serine hydrolase [Candidatus Elarobacter sp.]|jgi:CubicO group peptidase (beta-lactamase class C family)|nr:serine hydrolase [Candidatus Elarobacter sp.]